MGRTDVSGNTGRTLRMEVNAMVYEMEELVPIVADLARRYTANESTSLSYEKAQQLMEAVLYCIRETEQSGDCDLVFGKRILARNAYEQGYACVERKVHKALHSYHEILPKFVYYGNRCLYDTFIKGLPEFFKWYDVRFNPQDTLLTLDYPVLRDLTAYSGIDRISAYIDCIRVEQVFLTLFPELYVMEVLSRYDSGYRTMIDNLCEIVFISMTGHMLAGIPLTKIQMTDAEYAKAADVLNVTEISILHEKQRDMMIVFEQKRGSVGAELWTYFAEPAKNILIRMKSAAKHGTLMQLL